MHSLLQEYMDMTLLQFLQNWQRDNETIMAYIILQIVKGIQFIHSLFVIHRDLKAENIYVNFQGDVKIGDFGLSAQLCREKDERETVAGSPLWNSPEIINGRKYKCSCDIWSLGIICFEVISAVTPYSNCKNFVELAAKINKGPEPRIPENFSQDFQEFVRLCLQNDPGRRASAGDLLSTNFLRRVDEVSVKEEFAELVKAQIQLTSRDVVIDNNG
jgi:serine/threonine protein kinase